MFIEVGEQALVLHNSGNTEAAMRELKSATELARIIAYSADDVQQGGA